MIKRANGRGFCMLGFVSVKGLKEEQRQYGYQGFCFIGRDVFVCLLTSFNLANRCIMQVYLRKLPVVFDILNGHHKHELGTFTFSPVSDSRLLRSLLAL